MARKNFTVEQIILKLRKIEVLCGQGNTIIEAARQEEITEHTYTQEGRLLPMEKAVCCYEWG